MILLLQFIVSVVGIMLVLGLKRNVPPAAEKPFSAEAEGAVTLAAELKETCDAVVSRLEQRQAGLTRLLEEADMRIRLLEQLNERASRAADETARGQAPGLDARFNEVFELHDRGFTLGEIARQTSMDQGQVQLIFNLRRKLQ
jgi:hypothetical protein